MRTEALITGLGIVSPIGIGWKEFWPRLIAGEDGILPIKRFDTSSLSSKSAGEIAWQNLEDIYPSKQVRKMAILSVYALRAAKDAIQDAGLSFKDMKDAGLFFTTTHGAAGFGRAFYDGLIAEGIDGASPIYFSGGGINSSASYISLEFGIQGPVHTFMGGADTVFASLLWAASEIRRGRLKRALVGASEEIEEVPFSAYERLGYIGKSNKSQPFGEERRYPVLGEGAGFLVLESDENMSERKSYAKILEGSVGQDLSRDQNGLEILIKDTLSKSRLNPKDIELVVAGGSGRKEDSLEARALARSLSGTKVTAIRGATGESFAVAGLFQIVTLALALSQGVIPPTTGTQKIGNDCPINLVLQKIECAWKAGIITIRERQGGIAAVCISK